MSIIVLGTSNCIVRDSAIHIVRALAQEDVINVSVGSSPTSAGLFLMPTDQIKPGDVAILDYAIPDSGYIGIGLRKPVETRAYIRSIVHDLVALGCKPVMWLNPEEPALTVPPLAEIAHVETARELGVPVFNASAVLREAVKAGRTPADLMLDPAHQRPEVTGVIGRYLYDALMAARDLPLPTIPDDAARWVTRTIDAPPLVDASQRIERSSSLRSSRYAVLAIGQSLTFQIDEGEQVIGFMSNMGAPGGKAQFAGLGQPAVVNLMAPWANRNPDAYMSVFLDLQDRIFARDGAIEIKSVEEEVPLTQPNMMWREVDLDLFGTIHVEGILVGRLIGDDQIEVTSDRRIIDLLEGKEASILGEILAATGQSGAA